MQKLLLAEDDTDLRVFLRDELARYQFVVTPVGNGASAVIAAVEENFDAVVLDMLMPGLDGIQTIKVLRRIAPAMPIIGLTGYLGRGYIAEASAYGVRCLAKPVDIEDLVDEIHKTIKAAL
jgi:DNA-binding response OmpR family regulator